MKKNITVEISGKVVFFSVDNKYEVSNTDFAKMTNEEKLKFLKKLQPEEKRIYDLADPIGLNAFILDYNGQVLDGDNWWVCKLDA
jgi:hypothetical protein